MSAADTLRAVLAVVTPTVAQGAVLRRRRAARLAERLDIDRRAGQLLHELRVRYGPDPLRLRIPGRSIAIVLSPDDVHRILTESPEPFTPASREKRAALAHFAPDGVLISQDGVRTDRRRFNEAVLDADRPVHRIADAVTAKVREEAGLLLDAADRSGGLTWDLFAVAWWRIVRRVVLGDGARDDDAVTDLLATLRSDANWAYLRPKRRPVYRRFDRRLRDHLDRAGPDCLAGLLAQTPATPRTRPAGQVPHWLFAFDAAGITALRTLALLATHPAAADRARVELSTPDLSTAQDLPYLRACVQETIRLWPTTLVVLRDSTTPTEWNGAVAPAGTSFVILSSFFHRDEQLLPYADRFAPGIWLDGRAAGNPSLLPFSGGPARCPGRDLVLLVTSTLLAALLERHEFRLRPPIRLNPPHPLPRALDHFTLAFAVSGAAAQERRWRAGRILR